MLLHRVSYPDNAHIHIYYKYFIDYAKQDITRLC